MIAPFKMASISDIHLGHRRNKASFIIKNLDDTITNDQVFSTIKLLVLVGDVFDELLNSASDDYHDIVRWAANTLSLSHKHDVLLYVLEGTPSHDRKQSIVFETLNEIRAKAGLGKAKLKYVTELSIEYIEELGVTALFVPDEWGPSPQDTLDQVRQLLVEHDLETVDFAFMHGMFEHQLEFPGVQTHSSKDYLELVRCLIFIGHIHTYSNYDRIFAQGSFDRISQGEEGPKGYLTAQIETDYSYEVSFVENKNAAAYITIEVESFDVVENLLLIEEKIHSLRTGSHVRIKANHDNPILTNVALIKDRWPELIWAFQSKSKAAKESALLIDHKNTYVPVQLNRQTIVPVMSERLTFLNYPKDVVTRCTDLLKGVM